MPSENTSLQISVLTRTYRVLVATGALTRAALFATMTNLLAVGGWDGHG
jgi:hypothetical protein